MTIVCYFVCSFTFCSVKPAFVGSVNKTKKRDVAFTPPPADSCFSSAKWAFGRETPTVRPAALRCRVPGVR